MRKLLIYILLSLPSMLFAQQFNAYDRKVFNEGQVLTITDVEFAKEGYTWQAYYPIRLYSIHDEGGETIVTFAYSIGHDSQWVTFSKGLYVKDEDSGDIYKVRGYTGKLTMDRLLIVKGCKGKNVLIPLRFPKFKRKAKRISIYNPGHPDDIKPSNNREDDSVFASKVRVKDYRNVYKPRTVYE